jgi:hypothetical protein
MNTSYIDSKRIKTHYQGLDFLLCISSSGLSVNLKKTTDTNEEQSLKRRKPNTPSSYLLCVSCAITNSNSDLVFLSHMHVNNFSEETPQLVMKNLLSTLKTETATFHESDKVVMSMYHLPQLTLCTAHEIVINVPCILRVDMDMYHVQLEDMILCVSFSQQQQQQDGGSYWLRVVKQFGERQFDKYYSVDIKHGENTERLFLRAHKDAKLKLPRWLFTEYPHKEVYRFTIIVEEIPHVQDVCVDSPALPQFRSYVVDNEVWTISCQPIDMSRTLLKLTCHMFPDKNNPELESSSLPKKWNLTYHHHHKEDENDTFASVNTPCSGFYTVLSSKIASVTIKNDIIISLGCTKTILYLFPTITASSSSSSGNRMHVSKEFYADKATWIVTFTRAVLNNIEDEHIWVDLQLKSVEEHTSVRRSGHLTFLVYKQSSFSGWSICCDMPVHTWNCLVDTEAVFRSRTGILASNLFDPNENFINTEDGSIRLQAIWTPSQYKDVFHMDLYGNAIARCGKGNREQEAALNQMACTPTVTGLIFPRKIGATGDIVMKALNQTLLLRQCYLTKLVIEMYCNIALLSTGIENCTTLKYLSVHCGAVAHISLVFTNISNVFVDAVTKLLTKDTCVLETLILSGLGLLKTPYLMTLCMAISKNDTITHLELTDFECEPYVLHAIKTNRRIKCLKLPFKSLLNETDVARYENDTLIKVDANFTSQASKLNNKMCARNKKMEQMRLDRMKNFYMSHKFGQGNVTSLPLCLLNKLHSFT